MSLPSSALAPVVGADWPTRISWARAGAAASSRVQARKRMGSPAESRLGPSGSEGTSPARPWRSGQTRTQLRRHIRRLSYRVRQAQWTGRVRPAVQTGAMRERHATKQQWPQTLWIVRHGQSAGNVARDAAEAAGMALIDVEFRDIDVPLSGLGEEQSRALGRW